METLSSYAFEIIIGTYEEFLVGYYFKEESQELVESFSIHSHQGSVRCVAVTDIYVASGGNDETIQLYNMVTRKVAGTIIQHSGSVTALKFTPEKGHLISCSQDGSVAIFRVGSWQLEKCWESAHKGAGVNAIDIHPSSKLALTLGQNKTLRTWNLVKGRPAYTSNLAGLGKYLDLVVWSTFGKYYAVIADNKIFVFNINIAGIVSSIECNSRVTCMSFSEDNIICFGEEGGSIISYCITTNSELWRIKVKDIRIKCICCVSSKWLVSANSDGEIIVWEMYGINKELKQLASVNINCRITCMDVRISSKIEKS